jgi:plasmid replication initiation protein
MENLVVVSEKNELESIDIKNWVTKSNELIESTYKLSLQEQRILLVMASKVQPNDETLKTYRFRARDFIEIIGNKPGTGFYSYLKDIVNGLQTKVLTIKKDGKQRNYNWVITSIYEDNEGYITLQFHPELKSFFLQLKEKFTTYQLENVVRLNSGYSIRIYELLKQYEKIKRRKMLIEELRHFLAIEPTKYKQYGHFKSKVLLVAQNEINEKTDIQFEFIEIKTGRKVTGIEFIIKSNNYKEFSNTKQLSLINELEKDPLKSQLEDLGVSKDKLDWLLTEFSKEQIIRNIQYVQKRIKTGEIKHPDSYVIKAIQKDFAQTIDVSHDNSNNEMVDTKEKAIQQLINANIPKRKVKKLDLLSDYILEDEAIEIFKQYMNEEEAKDLWQGRKKEIVNEINKQRLSMIYS